MEDVREGINLTSLRDNTTHTSKGEKLQDFLSRPMTNFTLASDPSLPVTALTLSTRSEFHYDPLTHMGLQLAQPHHYNAPKVEPFSNLCENKRTLLSGDMRNARLMKNRESAARSRARKQAYLFELKQKIKHLQEENARLRRQQQLLRETATNQGKRGNLYRTYTAPF